MKNFLNFESFINESYSNEGEDMLNEAFNSSILQSLLKKSRWAKGLDKVFFNTLSQLGVAASDITDDQIITHDPKDANAIRRLSKGSPDSIFIYYSDSQKENPHASSDAWGEYRNIPAGVPLAVVKGGHFVGLDFDRWASKKYKDPVYRFANSAEAFGWNHNRKGWNSTGLNTLKKMADVADTVYVIDPSLVPSSSGKRAQRSASKSGATAFISDKEFKKQNLDRYNAILSELADKPSALDKGVKDSIDKITELIKDSVSLGKMGQWGDYLLGEDPKGREVRLQDATGAMTRLLDSYSKYVEYKKKATGDESSYYEKQAKEQAKDVKDRIGKIERLDIAW